MITALGTVIFAVAAARNNLIQAPASLILSVLLIAGGLVLARVCRHPQLSASWLRYRPNLRRTNVRRIGAATLTLLLSLLSVAFPIVALIFLVATTYAGSERDAVRMLASAAILSVGLGYLIDRLARRLRARTAVEAINDQKRSAILYLRNFGDDEVKVPTSPLSRAGLWQLMTAWANPFRQVRFEELLARLLGRWGPVIGFNDPNVKMATLGAAKVISPNDRWQEQLIEHAEKAYAVVISATPSQLRPGLRWELDMLATRLSHKRIILILGPQSSAATVTARFRTFAASIQHYPLFNRLSEGWLPNGTLVICTRLTREAVTGMLGQQNGEQRGPTPQPSTPRFPSPSAPG